MPDIYTPIPPTYGSLLDPRTREETDQQPSAMSAGDEFIAIATRLGALTDQITELTADFHAMGTQLETLNNNRMQLRSELLERLRP